jgi:ABC-type glycerol-3-phosphate transport system substrate-binding protein
MYNAMRQSYESGAEYVVVFNYRGDTPIIGGNSLSFNSSVPTGNCLLQASQFAAIQKFWKQVVENPRETNNVTTQDALVLPANFGGGMRTTVDGMWGIWHSNSTTQQVWNALQMALNKYGSKLDIIYDDPAYPTAGRYQHVVYWNQTA